MGNLGQSVAKEHLVRGMFIYKKSLAVDKSVRFEYLIRNLSFMGLGRGATPETELEIGS